MKTDNKIKLIIATAISGLTTEAINLIIDFVKGWI